MKKMMLGIALITTVCQLQGSISTVMNHRLITSSPLLYKAVDYTESKLSIEFEPFFSSMFDADHTIAHLTLNNQSSMVLDQLGNGDMNPEWILLAAANDNDDYHSTVTFTPELSMYGMLFHCYKQYKKFYVDLKTALLKCNNQIHLDEVGGGNGGMVSPFEAMNDEPIGNAYQAFTQNDWEYGKIGDKHSIIGFDNIQVTLGYYTDLACCKTERYNSYVSGFAVFEVPTGSGSTAEWLFEPSIGTNHWGVGFGADMSITRDCGASIFFGGDYRYIISGWETRSFDLQPNGAWSRYLGVELLENSDLTVGYPGINIFTQDALIDGRNQVNAYLRLQKKLEPCSIELSYNYFYNQAETISQVTDIPAGYGIFDMQGLLGGDGITASTATINESQTEQDFPAVELVTSDLDLVSGATGAWSSSMVTLRLARTLDFCTYGCGAALDFAHSDAAISTWSVWLNFEILI
jgi:hypothetical protein